MSDDPRSKSEAKRIAAQRERGHDVPALRVVLAEKPCGCLVGPAGGGGRWRMVEPCEEHAEEVRRAREYMDWVMTRCLSDSGDGCMCHEAPGHEPPHVCAAEGCGHTWP